jgi:Bacterial regulatory proteins, luxR family
MVSRTTQIAERLFLSPLTVKTHINRAMMKVAVRDRAQLVVLAYQTGLVRPRRQPRSTPDRRLPCRSTG